MTDPHDPLPPVSSLLWFDGAALYRGAGSPGRRFRADPRCFAGPPLRGCYAHVCASTDEMAALPYDDPQVQQARREALAWWVTLLGPAFVCLTTLALDAVRYGGAITVARDPSAFENDPFARIFAGTVVPTDLFCAVPAPPGPVIERYSGAAWPGGSFGGLGPVTKPAPDDTIGTR
jgi:hypothetical protein